MRLPRWFWFLLIFAIACFIQYAFAFSAYFLLFLICTFAFVFSEWYTRYQRRENRRENRELQEEVRMTAKDAHLKNKQLLTIVSSIPYPMLLIDQQGAIVMHNSVKGIEADALQKHVNYLHNGFYHPVQEFIKDAFLLERMMDTIITINGIEHSAISVPVTAKGRYSGCLVLFQDISKTLEGEKMQKRFIADASHELKTPIAVIKGMVEILNREDFDDEQTRVEFLHQIEAEINRLDILVKDLLQLSRLSLSKVLLEREQTDIEVLIDRVFSSLRKRANDAHLRLVKDCHTKQLLFCDPRKLEQVLINLVSNAIKYSDDGDIVVRTSCDDVTYSIEVEDHGCGIREENIPKIFERFFRVDDDRSRKSGGSGLGLPIVKSIMDAHEAEIKVTSTYGMGSCFTLLFKR